MSTLLIVVVLMLLPSGSGAYCGDSRHGGSGLRSVIGFVLVVSLPIWLFGDLHVTPA
jgi:hypothetical protein